MGPLQVLQLQVRVELGVITMKEYSTLPRSSKLESHYITFTNPSTRAGYDTRSIFKRSLTGLNSEFSFS